MDENISAASFFRGLAAALLVLVGALALLPCTARAESDRTSVFGQVYEFDGDSHYEFSQAQPVAPASSKNTYGTFAVSGPIRNISTWEGVPAFEVPEGNLDFYYTYGNTLPNADTGAQLTADKSRQVDSVELEDKIRNGVILLQTSSDRKDWVTASCTTDVFSAIPVQASSFYTSGDIQRINGCFFRLVVAYETRIPADPKQFLFLELDQYDYTKHAEVYEFYLSDGTAAGEASHEETYQLGSRVRTDKDGYAGRQDITEDDLHYGWDLGSFFVSGYTDTAQAEADHAVFLKNAGDRITLWFRLNQDIDALNGNKQLSITADHRGQDAYFETPRMDFGRGALIVRRTDHRNVAAEPVIYTNYLEASATASADTKVELFEEGDYEVALDYQVTRDRLIDKVSHYRIAFTFSVRNGNCMVFPFDAVTGAELGNSSVTENGFRLDLAKSRYLKVHIKRDIPKESDDGLVEDTRFNGPARDGASYTEEGIYTITVYNEYTRQSTVKRIYVGRDSVLKAHVTTGLSIPEIHSLVDNGAAIADDGTLQLDAYAPSGGETPGDAPSGGIIAAVAGLAVVIVAAAILLLRRRKKPAGTKDADDGEALR